MDYLTQYYKNRLIQLQEQIYNLNKLLVEVADEHNGTGGTPPPTVLYPNTNRDSPATMPLGDAEPTIDQFSNEIWQTWIAQHGEDMRRMGATPEQIANILRLLRQHYFLYQSGSQGNLTYQQILLRMKQFYDKLLAKESWYQSYWHSVRARGTINRGINQINNWTLNWPFNVPGIPNIDTQPTYP